jgi:hypothetical protein
MRPWRWLVLLLWSAVSVEAAVVGQDDFTVGVTTVLEAHTPTCGGGTCGAGWSNESNLLSISAAVDAVFSETSATAMGRKEDNIGSDEMDCTVNARTTNSAARLAGVCGRMTTANFDNAICAYLNGDGATANTVDLVLTKEVGGTITALAARFEANFAPDTDHLLRLKIRTNSIAVDLDATPNVVTATDNSLAGNTYCGIILNSNNSSTIRVLDFVSESVTAAPPAVDFFSRRRALWLQPKEWLHAIHRHLRPTA